MSDGALHAIFVKFDSDGSGKVDATELKAMTVALNFQLNDAELDSMRDGNSDVGHLANHAWPSRNFQLMTCIASGGRDHFVRAITLPLAMTATV